MKKSSLFLAKSKLVLLVFWLSAAHGETPFVLSEDEWSRPRTAAVVKNFAAVNEAIQLWLKDTQRQRIELRYPGGEEGSLWAQELQDWLVALGVPSAQLEIYPGYPHAGEIAIVVLP